jgi:hypothetical protein
VCGTTPVPPASACPCRGADSFKLDDKERFLFDLWATEHTGIGGTPLDFWSLDIVNTRRDPLYDEPIERAWNGPYRIQGWASMPDTAPSTGEEGFRSRFTAQCWMPRKALEDARAPVPSEGDVVRLWNTPYFAAVSVDNEPVDDAGYFFDVINVDEDGHLFDQPGFVGFKIDLVRRTEFTPERRLQT